MAMTVRERLSLIRDFHKKFGEPIAEEPRAPDEDLAFFRASIIIEEALELISALGFNISITPALGTNVVELMKTANPDLVKIVDSLRDLEYVMGGLEVALGLQEASEPTFLAVHRANMDKQPAEGVNKKPTKPPGWRGPNIRNLLQQLFPEKRLLFR